MFGLDDLSAALVASRIGAPLRRHYFERKRRRVEQGGPVRVRCRAHPDGHPDWRLFRGAVVRSSEGVRWRALLRRWRTLDLSHAVVGTIRATDSAIDGRRLVIGLGNAGKIDQLVVTAERGPLILRLLDLAAGRS